MQVNAKGNSSAETSGAAHIVVVEDDVAVADILREALVEATFRVSVARDGAALKAILATDSVQLITLDLGLPDQDGIDLAREIASQSEVPIMIVSGKGKKLSKIIGLEVGADDYIVKPFDLDELIARVRALLRRTRRSTGVAPVAAVTGETDTVTFEGWRYDIAGHRLSTPGGEVVDLTSSELDLLSILVRFPRTALSRTEIARHLRSESTAAERSIDVLVGRLRRKLAKYDTGEELIKTIRGEGYLFSPEIRVVPPARH